jgi:hypothetical protein
MNQTKRVFFFILGNYKPIKLSLLYCEKDKCVFLLFFKHYFVLEFLKQTDKWVIWQQRNCPYF